EQVSEIGRGLKMPMAATLDELDAAAFVMRRELTQRDLDLTFADMLGDLVERERRGGREQGRFDRAHQLVHQAALSLIGANGSSCMKSSRPRRASSSMARKLDASAERRNCGS